MLRSTQSKHNCTAKTEDLVNVYVPFGTPSYEVQLCSRTVH